MNFEEELRKFHPSLEIEDAEEAIYNQDLTDMADVLVGMIRESREKEMRENFSEETKNKYKSYIKQII